MKRHKCIIENYKSSHQGYVELCVSGLFFAMVYLISQIIWYRSGLATKLFEVLMFVN